MALSTGRVSNIVQIIGKDAASAEIEKAIKSLERMKKEADGVNNPGGGANSEMGSKLKKGAKLAAAAAVAFAAAAAAAKMLWDAGKEGAKFLDQLDLMRAGVEDFDGLMKRTQERTGGIVNRQSIVESATVFKNFGIDLTNFDKVAEQVAKTSISTGKSSEFLLNSIATGVARASPMILDNLGIQVKLSVVNEEYAKSLGKTSAALTDNEKKTALLNAVLAKLEENNKDVKFQDSRTASLNRAEVAYDDLALTVKGNLADAFVFAMDPMAGMTKNLNLAGEAVQDMRTLTDDQADALGMFTEAMFKAKLEGISLEEAINDINVVKFAEDARAAAVAEYELAEAGARAAESQALLAENLKRAANEAAGFAALQDKNFFKNLSTGGPKLKKRRGGGGSASEETKQARALAKALGVSRKEARKLVRALALQEANESRLKAHADFVEAKRKARAADLADEEAAIDAAVDEALAGLSRIEAAENAADQRKKDRLVAAAEHQRGLIDVAKTGADGQLANALALSDGLQGMWQADADLKKATAENDQQGIDDANKKKQQAEKSALAGGVALARQGAMALGASKKEMAFLDGLIEAARSYASFAIGDFGGGAAHAAASAAFFVASASGGGGGGGGGSKGGGGGPKRSKAISSASGSQQGGGTTIVNFQGFAIGSAAQLGSELSGALGAVRGTGQDRAAAV